MRATSAGTGARRVFSEQTQDGGHRHRQPLRLPETPSAKLRVCRAAARAAPIAFEAQRIGGTKIDVLLPKLEGVSLSAWATKLAGQHAFHDQTRALEELARVEMSPDAADKEDWRPTIAVLVSEPEAMFG